VARKVEEEGMTDPLPVRMVFGRKGAVRVEYESKEPRVTDRNATLHQLISEVKRPLWAAAAYSRLDELEAVVKAARELCEQLDNMYLGQKTCEKKDALKDALAKVGEERAK
jgi:hypothetical protein